MQQAVFHGRTLSLASLVPEAERRNQEGLMRSADTVTDFGLYASECCSAEMIFDDGDRFSTCPQCNHNCIWELEEEIVAQDEFDARNSLAA